jgi:3-phenylpropionate/trans-cinnamate dioxygenase ferredoxin subunit
MNVATQWVTVAATAEITPGERMVVEIGRDWVVVFNVDGKYYAIEDRCSHEDFPLSEGVLDDCVIECPQHNATFDIRTGEPLSAPAVSPVRRYPVRVEEGMVQVARHARR